MRSVLNFIFGDVSGGSKATAAHYEEKDNNIYEVPGDMKLTDFNNLTNFGIEDPRMTTIGGVAFRLLDRLPREGDRVEYEDMFIQVQEMDDHRIARVRVAKGVDEEDFNRSEEVIQAEDEQLPDPRLEDRDEIEDIPEAVEDPEASEPDQNKDQTKTQSRQLENVS